MNKKAQFLHWTTGIVSFAIMMLVITGVAVAANHSIDKRGKALVINTQEYKVKNEVNQFLNSYTNYEGSYVTLAEFYAIGFSNGEKFNGAKASTIGTFDNQLQHNITYFFGPGSWNTCSSQEDSALWILHQVSTGPCKTNLNSLKDNYPNVFVQITGFNSEKIMITVIEKRWGE